MGLRSDKALVSRSQDSRFETRFHQRSTVCGGLVQAESDVIGQASSENGAERSATTDADTNESDKEKLVFDAFNQKRDAISIFHLMTASCHMCSLFISPSYAEFLSWITSW
ncbi:hypothetical protein AVEN_109809-1 [Araneus ventricosus]|uniref:Uncharacterized protein n=1 Tax=Araneus ventricosus TaxID=182803 RepID=A0A4Y2GDT8_ARAVE|nr:hypothetical protein AVEN_109809-1 [Araneus ventricosus]